MAAGADLREQRRQVVVPLVHGHAAARPSHSPKRQMLAADRREQHRRGLEREVEIGLDRLPARSRAARCAPDRARATPSPRALAQPVSSPA